jgi:hypothetical protein
VDVIGGSTKSGTSAHLTGKLETSLPFLGFPSENLRLVLGLILIFEGEVNIPL